MTNCPSILSFRFVRMWVVALFGSAFLVAAGITFSSPALAVSTNTASADWGACPPPPAGLPDGGQECASLSLPLDYRHPNGQKISVSISRIKATSSDRRGVLLLNPGGPGGAGLDLPRLFALLLPQNVLNKYDLIGFDPRFIGTSSPLTCGLTPRQVDQVFVPLAQPGGFADTAALVKSAANACASHSNGVLPFATTANTARDMVQYLAVCFLAE